MGCEVCLDGIMQVRDGVLECMSCGHVQTPKKVKTPEEQLKDCLKENERLQGKIDRLERDIRFLLDIG